MIFELLLLGSGAALLHSGRRKPKFMLIQAKKPISGFHVNHLLRDINSALQLDGSQELQLDLDPKLQETSEQARRKAKCELWLSTGATGLAILGNIYPLFALAGAGAVLYLSRELFSLIAKDFRHNHYLTVYVVGLIGLLGMMMTGHLVLAAAGGIIGGFFANIINRLEETSQQQMVRIFGGHPQKVWLLRDGLEIQIDFHALQPGDTLVINAGEVIPADGEIQSGEGQVDQHLLTGESQPVEKRFGDKVFAATLLLSGRLVVNVETAGKATVAAKIGDVLEHTQHYKDTLMNRGRQTADRFVPVTLGLGAITLPILGVQSALAVTWSNLGGIMAAAGPLSVLSYLQILSRHSILIKDGRVFESLRAVDTIVFDKTGTLTLEQPTVGAIHAMDGFDETTVLRYAAAAEYRQPHPIAKAILAKAAAAQVQPPKLDSASYDVGYGIQITVEGKIVRVGSARFLQQADISLPEMAQIIKQQAEYVDHSLIYVSIDTDLAGIIELQPTLRPEAIQIIQSMRRRDMKLYIISGDHKEPTRQMATTLGIENYFAEVLPHQKADLVKDLRNKGRFVCFIGDGINDAIALKSAQVSISLKGASSAATDTAQIVFMDGTLKRLEQLFKFADEFEITMQRNYAISIVPGTITIGGIYLLHFGVAASMGICYLGCFAGLGNILWPLVKHQDKNLLRDTMPRKTGNNKIIR